MSLASQSVRLGPDASFVTADKSKKKKRRKRRVPTCPNLVDFTRKKKKKTHKKLTSTQYTVKFMLIKFLLYHAKGEACRELVFE